MLPGAADLNRIALSDCTPLDIYVSCIDRDETQRGSPHIKTWHAQYAPWPVGRPSGSLHRLRELGHEVELVMVSTRGDREQTQAIGTIGGDGLFTKELQRSLLAGEIDLAVHSLKDLPTEPIAGLRLGAVPERGPTRDVLVARKGMSLAQLPTGAQIGTGSQRRRAQLLHHRPDLVMRDIRGNVDTRLRKLHAAEYDAIVLAEAGLARLGFADQITEALPVDVMLPAVGQGALGVECREDDAATQTAVAALDHADTHASVTAERAMLRAWPADAWRP